MGVYTAELLLPFSSDFEASEMFFKSSAADEASSDSLLPPSTTTNGRGEPEVLVVEGEGSLLDEEVGAIPILFKMELDKESHQRPLETESLPSSNDPIILV